MKSSRALLRQDFLHFSGGYVITRGMIGLVPSIEYEATFKTGKTQIEALRTCRASVVHRGADSIEQLTRWSFKLFDGVDWLGIFLGVAGPKLFVRFVQEPGVALHGRAQ